jgi:hypothetical protein
MQHGILTKIGLKENEKARNWSQGIVQLARQIEIPMWGAFKKATEPIVEQKILACVTVLLSTWCIFFIDNLTKKLENTIPF